eukprot:m.45090 g.45090  ORF g.45090 m.45090 type:complete len:240 (+) comp10186_c0_seq2:155-874(+)
MYPLVCLLLLGFTANFGVNGCGNIPIPYGYVVYQGRCANSTHNPDAPYSYPTKYQCLTSGEDSPLECHNLCEATENCNGYEVKTINMLSFCHIIDNQHPSKAWCNQGWNEEEGHSIYFQNGDNDPYHCCFKRLKGPVPKKQYPDPVSIVNHFIIALGGMFLTYAFVGYIYNWSYEGKQGLTAFPNYNMWCEIGICIKDGFRFTRDCLTGRTFVATYGGSASYQSIQGEVISEEGEEVHL